MRIRYFCHYGQLTGYGRAARDYLAALAFHLRHATLERHIAEHGVDAAYDPVSDPGAHELQIIDYGDLHAPHLDNRGARTTAASPEARYEHLDHLVVDARRLAELAPADVEIHHGNPRLLAQIAAGDTWRTLELAHPLAPARRRVGITTWETSVFPEPYAAAFRARDEAGRFIGFSGLIVPSRFCAEVIDQADDSDERVDRGGPPIAVLPHCFDPTFWQMEARWLERDLRPTPDTGLPVRFYTIGAPGDRKNIAGVIKAYLHAFSSLDAVSLMVVGANPNEVRAICAASGLPADRQAPVHAVTGTIDERTLLELHGDADCYVSATRGEGWGLGLFEAAIMGRAIITPLYGGHRDFLLPDLLPPEAGVHDGLADYNPGAYPWCADVAHTMTPCFGSEVRGEIQQGADGRMFQRSTIAIPPGVNAKQMWAEPALDELAEAMVHYYNARHAHVTAGDWEEASHLPRTAGNLRLVAQNFANRYGYAAIGERFYHLLQEILAP